MIFFVEYSVKSESGLIIAPQDKAYYVSVLPKYLRVIYPQVTWTSKGCKGTSLDHYHDYNGSYADLKFK